MANESSSSFISFLADDDDAVHVMMTAGVDNGTAELPTSDDEAGRNDDDSCDDYNWPVLCLFTIVIAAIGTTCRSVPVAHRAVVKSGSQGQGQSGQTVKLFQITAYTSMISKQSTITVLDGL